VTDPITPSDLAALSGAVVTTVLGFKLNGYSELLTPVGRVAGYLPLLRLIIHLESGTYGPHER